MPPRDVRARLFDIRESCDFIAEDVHGLALDDYLTRRVVRQAVERNLVTVGEALNAALKLDFSLNASITDPGPIVAFRNLLVHGYDIVDHATVWDIVKIHVPVLRSEVDRELKRRGG